MSLHVPLLTCAIIALPQVALAQSITGQAAPCTNNSAQGYPCKDITLLSMISVSDLGATSLNDVWGWVDAASSREFALAGTRSHVAFVEVTDPVNPVVVGTLPSHDPIAKSTWRDMKVYQDYMFVTVDGRGKNGLQVFDLRNLLSPPSIPHEFEQTAHYDGFDRAHNIVINESTGFAYATGTSNDGISACPPGLHMIDITDPENPAFAGCFTDTMTGRAGNGYTHDAQCVTYQGPDTDYAGKEICIGSNETAISIADVTEKSNPVKIVHADYPDVHYAHQGWLTYDHKYFLQNDELDERTLLQPGERGTGTRTLVWDVTDLDDPVLHLEYWGTTQSSDHNLYVRGRYAFLSNYTTGLRIVDIFDINTPVEVAHFDTHEYGDGLEWDGAWSAYPYLPSGTILVNSDPTGLFMLKPANVAVQRVGDTPVPASFELSAAYPNPFNPVTSLTLNLPWAGPVDVRVHDVTGREVALLLSGVLAAGPHTVHFVSDNHPSGTYLVKAKFADHVQTRSVTLVR